MTPVETSDLAALPLHSRTPIAWGRAVLAEPLSLLVDHAFLEKKAATNALELLTRWPNDWLDGWVDAMTSVARDEVNHLAQVSVPAVLKTDPELDKLSEHAKARKRELLAKGLSTSYVNLCFDAYAHGIISGGRIAEMMLVDNFELNEIAELFNLKMQAQ